MPAVEAIIEPELAIVDPHHHLWDRRALLANRPPPQHPFEEVLTLSPRYLLDELLADLNSGHHIVATVYVQCGAFYRADGPTEMKPLGETEVVNGVAAMSASGVYGPSRACAGIVGHADLARGTAARAVLEAHNAVTPRFKGVRQSASWDADPKVLGPLVGTPEGLYRDKTFREGFAQLAPLGLSFDAWMLEPQLSDLVDLARAFPDTAIVLDHVGTPLGIGVYAGKREERFAVWRDDIKALAACPNVVVKLGGLAMPFAGFEVGDGPEPLSTRLAALWAPYIETCIDAFGAERCMFESNFPVDLFTCPYDVLWNALKLTAKGCSADEKAALFSGTAKRVYRLEL